MIDPACTEIDIIEDTAAWKQVAFPFLVNGKMS